MGIYSRLQRPGVFIGTPIDDYGQINHTVTFPQMEDPKKDIHATLTRQVEASPMGWQFMILLILCNAI